MLTPTSSCSENLLDFGMDSCNLLANLHPRTKDSLSLTPITDIRYEIVDLFTKGTSSHLHHPHHHQPAQQQAPTQQQQISPLPSIASLMNRHSSQASPVVSPTKQTIGINTDPLTTSTTNILHQPVATSWFSSLQFLFCLSSSFFFKCFNGAFFCLLSSIFIYLYTYTYER